MKENKPNYSFVCEYAFIGEKRKIGAIGIFEKIRKGWVIPSWFIVTNFTFKCDKDVKLKIKLFKDGKELDDNFLKKELDMKADAFSDFSTTTIIQLPYGKTFEELGEYSLNTYINENLIGEAKFKVLESI